MATDHRQWRDIAYCLSLLPFNSEIMVKRLVEGELAMRAPMGHVADMIADSPGLPFYQDKLHDAEVYKYFAKDILGKVSHTAVLSRATRLIRDAHTQITANKAAKNEQDLQEYENALEEFRAKGTEEQEMAKKVAKSKKKAGGKAKPRARARKAVSETPPSSPER